MNNNEKIFVIGSTLPALIYSFANRIPFLTTSKIEPPLPFDRFSYDLSLKSFHLKNDPVEHKSPFDPPQFVGMEKWILWQRLWFLLSLGGLNPMSDKPDSLIIMDGQVNAPFGGSIRKFDFDRLIVFSDQNVINLPPPIPTPIPKLVYDYFKVTEFSEVPYDFMMLPDELCRETLFHHCFGSDRVPLHRDIVGISELSDEQIQMEEFSEIEARFKMRFFVEKISDRIVFESDGREIVPTRMKDYPNTENIEFHYETDEWLIQTSFIQNSYASRIMEKLDGVHQ